MWHVQLSKNSNLHLLLLICLFQIQIQIISSQNATTCMNMYRNNSITTECINNSTCCFLSYQFYNNTMEKCLIKANESENLCSTMEDVIVSYGATNTKCECSTGLEWTIFTYYKNLALSLLIFNCFILF